MEQVKTVGRFIWQYRFWFSIAASMILASLLYFSGATSLLAQAERRKSELENVFKAAEGFRNKSDAPNPRWEEEASKREAELAKTVDGVWGKLFKQQEKLFTWPADVSKVFAVRPFGADLSDNRGKYLIDYRFAYPSQLDELWELVDPVRRNDEGKVVGVVEFRKEQLPRANWAGPVRSMEAWLAQEQLWIYRAILLAVAKANKGRDSWRNSVIRRIVDIRIGDAALDSKTRAANPTIVNGMENTAEEKHKSFATAKQENSGYQPVRYLTKNDQFREVPVFVSLLVEQTKATPVLTCLADADLGFALHQASLYVPVEKLELPLELRADGKAGKSSERDDPLFNTMQLDVWGRVRIYEMPPSMKEEFKKKQEAAEKKPESAGGDAPKAEAAAGEPAKAEATPKEAAKTEAPKAATPQPEPKKAEPPKAEPAKNEPAKVEAAKTDPARKDAAATEKKADEKEAKPAKKN